MPDTSEPPALSAEEAKREKSRKYFRAYYRDRLAKETEMGKKIRLAFARLARRELLADPDKRERLLSRHRADRKRFYQKNRAAIIAESRAWQKANPERFKAITSRFHRLMRSELREVYIVDLIKRGSNIKREDIPDSLIESWREVIDAKRMLRTKTKAGQAAD